MILDDELVTGTQQNLAVSSPRASGFLEAHDVEDEQISEETDVNLPELPSKLSSFKLKKMNVLSNLKVLTDKFHSLTNNYESEILIEEADSAILDLLRKADTNLFQCNDLLTERKQKKPSQKRQPVASQTYLSIPAKKAYKHPYSGRIGQKADMMKQFYRAKLTLEAMYKDYRIATTNKKETSITNAATGDTFVEVQTTEEAKETTKEINNMESDEQVEVEVECTGVLGTTIRQYVTKPSPLY